LRGGQHRFHRESRSDDADHSHAGGDQLFIGFPRFLIGFFILFSVSKASARECPTDSRSRLALDQVGFWDSRTLSDYEKNNPNRYAALVNCICNQPPYNFDACEAKIPKTTPAVKPKAAPSNRPPSTCQVQTELLTMPGTTFSSLPFYITDNAFHLGSPASGGSNYYFDADSGSWCKSQPIKDSCSRNYTEVITDEKGNRAYLDVVKHDGQLKLRMRGYDPKTNSPIIGPQVFFSIRKTADEDTELKVESSNPVLGSRSRVVAPNTKVKYVGVRNGSLLDTAPIELCPPSQSGGGSAAPGSGTR
jgi:hypothetical protein